MALKQTFALGLAAAVATTSFTGATNAQDQVAALDTKPAATSQQTGKPLTLSFSPDFGEQNAEFMLKTLKQFCPVDSNNDGFIPNSVDVIDENGNAENFSSSSSALLHAKLTCEG